MIKDATALQEIRSSWDGVGLLRERVQRAILGAFAQGASAAYFAADAANNLPFVHACSVLNDVLLQLAREGRFPSKSIFLGRLLTDSETYLPWLSIQVMKEAVDRRNAVAHRGEVLPRADCWKYIDEIEAQLVAWQVVMPRPPKK